jgi:hypothetical protein
MDDFFRALHEFKYSDGSIVDKFKELENLFSYFSQPELSQDEEVLACHLVFDACEHMVHSRHFRQFEYAGERLERIEHLCRNLIAKTKLDIKESLYMLIEQHRGCNKLEMQGLNKFISFRSSWDFYLVEGTGIAPELRIFGKEFGILETRFETKSRSIKERGTDELNPYYLCGIVGGERKRMRLCPDT